MFTVGRHDAGCLLCFDTLSREAARKLAQSRGFLELPAMTRLSAERAKAITNRESAVLFRRITTRDGADALAVAEALASTPAPVYLGNLERDSAPALAALRKKATITLAPDEKLTIVP